MRRSEFLFTLLVLSALLIPGCRPQLAETTPAAGSSGSTSSDPMAFTLQTNVVEGRMVYVGVGGDIEGVVNPDLVVQPGVTLHVTLINGDGIPHDLSFPDFKAKTALLSSKGRTTEVGFDIQGNQTGTYAYFCTQPGHRQAGQEGRLIVTEP